MLRLIARFLRILNSEADPWAISIALCLGMLAGLTPFYTLHNLGVLLILLLFRLNISAFILSLILCSGLAYLLDPLFHYFGLALLTSGSLSGLWISLYDSTFWRLTGFNNSIILGSVLFSALLFAPLALLLKIIIIKYREHILAVVNRTRLMTAFKASKLYRIYSGLGTLRTGGGAG